jgi:hypothetical protein
MLAPRKSRRLTGFINETNEHAFGRCHSLSFDAPHFIADVQSRLNQRQASHFLSAVDSDKKRRGEPAHFSRFGASSPVGSPNFDSSAHMSRSLGRALNLLSRKILV